METTSLNQLLNVKHPIIMAPMFLVLVTKNIGAIIIGYFTPSSSLIGVFFIVIYYARIKLKFIS